MIEMGSLTAQQALKIASVLPQNAFNRQKFPRIPRVSIWASNSRLEERMNEYELNLREFVEECSALSQWSMDFATKTETWISEAIQDDEFFDPEGKLCEELEMQEQKMVVLREKIEGSQRRLRQLNIPSYTKRRVNHLYDTWIMYTTNWVQALRTIRSNVLLADGLHESDTGRVFENAEAFIASLT